MSTDPNLESQPEPETAPAAASFRSFSAALWALPGPAKIALVAAAGLMLVVLYLAGQGAVQHFRDRRTDAVLEDVNRKLDEARSENDQLKGELLANQKQLDETHAALDAKSAELAAFAKEAKTQDANLQRSSEGVRQARAGRAARPVRDRDDLDKRLLQAYPAPQ